MAITNLLSSDKMHVLTQGMSSSVQTLASGSDEVLATWYIPFRCRVIKCIASAIVATAHIVDVNIYNASTSAAISDATSDAPNMNSGDRTTISIDVTDNSLVYAANTIIDLRGDPAGSSTLEHAGFSLVVINVETP